MAEALVWAVAAPEWDPSETMFPDHPGLHTLDEDNLLPPDRSLNKPAHTFHHTLCALACYSKSRSLQQQFRLYPQPMLETIGEHVLISI